MSGFSFSDLLDRLISQGLAAIFGTSSSTSSAEAPVPPVTPTAPPWGASPKPSPASLCAAITVEDLRAVGLQPDLDMPSVNPSDDADDSVGAYCGYTSASAAMGGIEFDVFYDDQPLAIQRTILGEGGGEMTPAGLPDVDESLLGLSITAGGPPFASILVRRANCVFTIGIPTGPNARDQLLTLAGLALQRLPS